MKQNMHNSSPSPMIRRLSISPALPSQNKIPERMKALSTIGLNILYFKKQIPNTTRLTGKHKPGG